LPLFKDAIKDPKKYAIFRAWAAQMDFQRPLTVAPGTPKERIVILRKGLSDTLKDPALLEEARKSKLVITFVTGEKTERLVDEILSMSPQAGVSYVNKR
jgi:tripartite-type tricarboxylate transporter receptor subunit TctC